jgi:hypothetical protein
LYEYYFQLSQLMISLELPHQAYLSIDNLQLNEWTSLDDICKPNLINLVDGEFEQAAAVLAGQYSIPRQ